MRSSNYEQQNKPITKISMSRKFFKEDGKCVIEIRSRITIAKVDFQKLNKILKIRNISINKDNITKL